MTQWNHSVGTRWLKDNKLIISLLLIHFGCAKDSHMMSSHLTVVTSVVGLQMPEIDEVDKIVIDISPGGITEKTSYWTKERHPRGEVICR